MPKRFGAYGGAYVPETLVPALQELDLAWRAARRDPKFRAELSRWSRTLGGRPTPLYFAENLTRRGSGAQIWFKREDLLHGGAHKFNNALGQGLLARRMGKQRLIAETGAGQHGVATAIIGAALGLPTEVYMGARDMERQAPNVQRMRLLGAELHPVTSGAQTLKDAINEALRDWITNVRTTHYILGSAVGPHPFPSLVCDFQSVIGRELRTQSRAAWGRLPDLVVACVGGGSNAIGTFHPLLRTPVKLLGVEAGGKGQGVGASSLVHGTPGILHGAYSVHSPRLRRSSPGYREHLRRVGLRGGRTRACDAPRLGAGSVHFGAGRPGRLGIPLGGPRRGNPAGARAGPRDLRGRACRGPASA